MTTADDLARILDTAGRLADLDRQFRQVLAEYRRGGLPTSSMGPGTRSGAVDSPALTLDAIDRRITHDRDLYRLRISAVAASLDELLRVVQAWTISADRLPDPDPVACDNTECARLVTNLGGDRLRRSPARPDLRVCHRCYAHERRHGSPWRQPA